MTLPARGLVASCQKKVAAPQYISERLLPFGREAGAAPLRGRSFSDPESTRLRPQGGAILLGSQSS